VHLATTIARTAAKVALVAATLVCLASLGGVMAYAFVVLVPLHWLATRESGPYEHAMWTVLAALSVFEATWIIGFVATGSDVGGAVIGVALGLATAVLFLRMRLVRVDPGGGCRDLTAPTA
jgi:hypothetical protein